MKTNLITKSKSITNPEYGCKPEEREITDYISKGIINLDGEEVSVKMFSMQNPITTLKNKFAHDKGRFYEIIIVCFVFHKMNTTFLYSLQNISKMNLKSSEYC